LRKDLAWFRFFRQCSVRNYQAALAYADLSDSPAIAHCAAALRLPQANAQRVELPAPFVRQHRVTCVPARLRSSRFLGTMQTTQRWRIVSVMMAPRPMRRASGETNAVGKRKITLTGSGVAFVMRDSISCLYARSGFGTRCSWATMRPAGVSCARPHPPATYFCRRIIENTARAGPAVLLWSRRPWPMPWSHSLPCSPMRLSTTTTMLSSWHWNGMIERLQRCTLSLFFAPTAYTPWRFQRALPWLTTMNAVRTNSKMRNALWRRIQSIRCRSPRLAGR
jgi:hypothetical protein